ncbi:MAG: ABC transporter substrate-binding protein, partial [Bacteriovorax sp.]
TFAFKGFEQEGISVDLMTKNLGEIAYCPAPNFLNPNERKKLKQFGKATGTELINLVTNGQADGATIGETAFIYAVEQGLPILAVAQLGHDIKGHAGHAIVVRNNINLTGPESFKGLRFGARRSAGGDEVMIKEFLVHSGVNPKDVKIIRNISDDKIAPMLKSNELDIAYAHLAALRKWIERDKYPIKIFKALDWVDPELSQSLLIFSKKFYNDNPDKVKKILAAYMKRIDAESKLETGKKSESNIKGLQIELSYEGLSNPRFEKVPVVRQDLLDEWQALLVKHGALQKKADLSNFIDNSMVLSLSKELKLINH